MPPLHQKKAAARRHYNLDLIYKAAASAVSKTSSHPVEEAAAKAERGKWSSAIFTKEAEGALGAALGAVRGASARRAAAAAVHAPPIGGVMHAAVPAIAHAPVSGIQPIAALGHAQTQLSIAPGSVARTQAIRGPRAVEKLSPGQLEAHQWEKQFQHHANPQGSLSEGLVNTGHGVDLHGNPVTSATHDTLHIDPKHELVQSNLRDYKDYHLQQNPGSAASVAGMNTSLTNMQPISASRSPMYGGAPRPEAMSVATTPKRALPVAKQRQDMTSVVDQLRADHLARTGQSLGEKAAMRKYAAHLRLVTKHSEDLFNKLEDNTAARGALRFETGGGFGAPVEVLKKPKKGQGESIVSLIERMMPPQQTDRQQPMRAVGFR